MKTDQQLLAEAEAQDFPPCTTAGCKRTAANPPCLIDGKPVCCKCATAHSPRCRRCGASFEPEYGGFDCYAQTVAGVEGAACCVECFAQGPA